MPKINIVFYSTKTSNARRENCYIKLYLKDKQIIYKLNLDTRLFEQEYNLKKEKTSPNFPNSPGETEER